MNKKVTSLLFLWALTLLLSCKTSLISEDKAYDLMKEYRENWYYLEQTDTNGIEFKVLYFQSPVYTLIVYPAFCIGVTNHGDTIGAIDRGWHLPQKPIKVGTTIRLGLPVKGLVPDWPLNHTPGFSIERDPEILMLHERVSVIYNGTFHY
jgi:hypothetical protein